MPVTHGVASSSLVQTANPNQESLSPTGWGTFASRLCLPQCKVASEALEESFGTRRMRIYGPILTTETATFLSATLPMETLESGGVHFQLNEDFLCAACGTIELYFICSSPINGT